MPTSMTPTLSKECYFGIVPQTQNDAIQGSYEGMGASNLFPVTAASSLDYNPNRDVLRMADYQDYALEALVRSQGEWWEGDVEIALMPGATANLLTLIQTRSTYNQGYFASCYFHMTHWTRRFWDVKVRQARFRWSKGDIIRCVLSLIAMDGDGTADAGGTFPADALPYVWKETTVSLETAGSGSVSAVARVEEIDLTLDNFVHDGSDGLRITNSGKMQRLYNLAGIGCEGTFNADATDNLIWNDWMGSSGDPTVADMTLAVARGGNNITFTIRGMAYTGLTAPLPGDNVSRVTTGATFTATSPDGASAPITLS